MRSGITSLFFILPLLAGLSERFMVHAAPQSPSADRAALEAQLKGLLSPFRKDLTPDCSADRSDGYQVEGSQDASPLPLVFAGWEGVSGDFGDVKPFKEMSAFNMADCARYCWTQRKTFEKDQVCKAIAFDVEKTKCKLYPAEPEMIIIDKKYNNASSIAVFDQICPDNKIKLEGTQNGKPCCKLEYGISVIKQGL